ncbi:RNA 2',3'-cyclic phosphodiesterase [Candidatus Gracilibacteria bacterium]|nr:RNA 2',3'-cyclic phosphodiesterase [Candidatus Gracilibacteria bacterium]
MLYAIFIIVMTPLRLFLAIPVPESIKRSLLQFQIKNNHLEKLSVRWTPEKNLHVTLFFLGDILPQNITPLTQLLKMTFSDFPSFYLEFEKFVIQSPQDPRMIWAQMKDCEVFAQLSQKVFHLCRKFMEEKFPQKRQIPHITLARLRDVSPLLKITSFPLTPNQIDVPHIELWQSQRFPHGVQYTCLEKLLLPQPSRMSKES